MNVSYLGPLQRAIARARSILFTPFRLETWLVLGFAAFLSEWLSGGWGEGGWQRRVGGGGHGGVHLPGTHWPDLAQALVWGPVLAGLILLVIIAGVFIMWLGSRGKFVFLDDVARGRAAIVEPWKRFAHLGDSLFRWRLGFWILSGLVVGGLVFMTVGAGLVAWLRFREPLIVAPPVFGGLALAGFVGMLVAFVSLLLDEFVVPLMYRHGLRANDAWRRFLPLLREHLGQFVLYALFVMLLVAVVTAVLMAVGFATCCIGFLLVLMPYVRQVVLLPVYVAYRGLGPEFLAQFGPEFQVFVSEPPAQVPATPPPAAPGPGTPA